LQTPHNQVTQISVSHKRRTTDICHPKSSLAPSARRVRCHFQSIQSLQITVSANVRGGLLKMRNLVAGLGSGWRCDFEVK
jgi:hypothetical protein